ncbi:hypothetical protein B0H67DRAFT_657010, partial [Lasiosphaeris hirsuta]
TPRPSYDAIIANVSVIDTPIVRAAQDFVRIHSSDKLYNHIMRAWLYGSPPPQPQHHLARRRRQESPRRRAHAPRPRCQPQLGLPFCDAGLVLRGRRRLRSAGLHPVAPRRCALGGTEGAARVEYNSAALREPKFALFKEPDVVSVYLGNDLDVSKPTTASGITDAKYRTVLETFPKVNQTGQVLEGITWYCVNKPESTYAE